MIIVRSALGKKKKKKNRNSKTPKTANPRLKVKKRTSDFCKHSDEKD